MAVIENDGITDQLYIGEDGPQHAPFSASGTSNRDNRKKGFFARAFPKFLFALCSEKYVYYNSIRDSHSQHRTRRDGSTSREDREGPSPVSSYDLFWIVIWILMILTAARYGYVIAEKVMGV